MRAFIRNSRRLVLAAGRRVHGVGRNDAGDTLVELLISMVILSLAVGALITGLLNVEVGSASYRSLTTIDTVLRTAATEASSEIQANAATAFACPATYSGPTFNTPPNSIPTGYTATSTMSYYTPSTGVEPESTAACDAFSAAGQSWALSVTVRVTNTSQGATDTGTIIVNDPAAPVVQVGTMPAQLVFQQQTLSPATAGTGFTVVVLVEDNSNPPRIVTGDLSTVTLRPSQGTMTGCSSTEIAGAITFSNCTIDTTGTYTLTATETSESGVSPAQNSIVVNAGPPAALQFTPNTPNTNPITTPPTVPTLNAVQAFPTQPQVTVEDAYGNIVTTDTSTVTLGITPGTGVASATLSGCQELRANGVFSFTNCNIDKASTATAYTLTATDLDGQTSLTAVSSPFYVQPWVPYQLAFSTQPTGGVGGAAFPTQPVVAVEDAGGNLVTIDPNSAAVTLAITAGTGTPNASLSCTANPISVASGLAKFSGCAINDAGNGYTITATDPETVNGNQLLSATSNPFDITGAPTQLVFKTLPSATATAGTPFATEPQIAVEDANGDVVTSDTSAVTLTLSPASPISCTANPVSAVAGIASFAGCEIKTAGSYTVTATDGSLAPTDPGAPIVVSPASPAQLMFTAGPPGTVTAGVAFPVAVSVDDAYGNVVSTNSSTVSLGVGLNPGNSTLTCSSNSVQASAGVANFSGCTLTGAANGYTLTAADGTLSGTSSLFNVVASSATKIVFTVQPGNGTGGVSFAPQPVVTIEDMYGNAVTRDSSTVDLALGKNPGGGTLSSNCGQINEAAGSAQFGSCSINKPGTGYTVVATDGSLPPVTSAPFNIAVGPAAQVVFSGQPTSVGSGVTFSPPLTVSIEDAGGNLVTAGTYSVSVSVTPGTGSPGASITCSANAVNTVSGVATFSNCVVDQAGTSFTLTATATSGAMKLTGTSNPFSISAGTPVRLVFTTPPPSGSTPAGTSFSPGVTVEDANGNPVNDATSTVGLAVSSGPGTLNCATNPVSTTTGVASFSCDITTPGSYKITATDGSLTPVTSGTFQIIVGAPSSIVFSNVANTTAGSNFAPVVTVQDTYGNDISNAQVTLAVTSGSVPTGCTTNTATTNTNGVATFSGCDITVAGSYSLTATVGSATGTSNTFTIAPGPAASLVFRTSPSPSVSGVPFTTQPVVAIEDSYGNVLTNSSAAVTIGTASWPPGHGTPPAPSCVTNPLPATNGIATFSGCSITLPTPQNPNDVGAYTLSASASGLSATSASFTEEYTSSGTRELVFTTSPSSGTLGTPFAVQPVVTVETDTGADVADGGLVVTLSISSTTASRSGTLSCTATTNASGVANFSGCEIAAPRFGNGQGTYTLEATAPALTPGNSAPFPVTN